MKKFISMVMAAAMVVSLVPATAFAANAATFKVVGDLEWTEDAADLNKDVVGKIVGPEVQMKVTDINNATGSGDSWKITLDFENAEVSKNIGKGKEIKNFATVKDNDGAGATLKATATYDIAAEDDSVAITLTETVGAEKEELEEDDIIVLDLAALGLYMTKTSDVTVTVGGKFGDSDAMTVVSVLEEGITVTLKKVNDVAEEESEFLKSDLIVEADVDKFVAGQVVELKLNSGFEWDGYMTPAGLKYNADESDDDVLVFDVTDAKAEFVFKHAAMKIEAVDAKVGDVAKITVKVKEGTADAFKGTATVDAMEVIGEAVTISVDEDEDVPVMYSGAYAGTKSLNVDATDFVSLEVTIEESVSGALDVKKDLELMLPEGVYVTKVEVTENENVEVTVDNTKYTKVDDIAEYAFKAAYEEGKHEGFVFDRKTFTETENGNTMELSFKLELMAVPGFVGDVVLTMDGPAFEDAQEVTIAKFVAPYTVEATQNDMIIDYRNTEVPTTIVVKEAEAGLWADGDKAMEFGFSVDHMTFEDDAVITVDEASEMEVKDFGRMSFVVDEESDEEAAVVTISDIELYMSRSLPAGAYDLELGTNAGKEMMTTALWTSEDEGEFGLGKYCVADIADWDLNEKGTAFEGESAVVKEAWINVVTAGRDQDDASFTKKVVVTIGADTLVAGEDTVALDVPAYINAAGYTMLPVRAVAVALGIHNNNVIWDQATKTVTILYGQRIITMAAGSKVINVNGSAIPASAAVEIVNGRTFLGLRDLATALGVVDITWDAATQTATMNGNK